MSSSCSRTRGVSRGGSGSGGGGDDQLPRYILMNCRCGRKVAIKITLHSPKNRGKLYCVCETGQCRFWAWCQPIGYTCGTSDRLEKVVVHEAELEDLHFQMRQMEANQEILKKTIGLACFLVVVVVVVCILK